MTTAKQYKAFGKDVPSILGDTPRQAARAFFAAYPNKRKCDIVEGVQDGFFFTVTYGRASAGEWPRTYDDVTKGGIDALPDA